MQRHKSSKKHKTSKQKGFSLIELLIVVAIILIIAAIAIPNLLRSRIAANEASAVGSLRTLNTAEITYNMTYPSVGFACSLSQLGGSGSGAGTSTAAGVVDANLASGTKSGYTFTASNCTGTPKSNYQYAAAPVSPGTTGQRYFCTDTSGVIQYNASAAITTCGTSTTPI